jgi:hypothetical protein
MSAASRRISKASYQFLSLTSAKTAQNVLKTAPFQTVRGFSTESGKPFDTTLLFELRYTEVDTKANIHKYKTDTQTLARWLDTSITNRGGKAFSFMREVVPKEKGLPFPFVDCYSLDSLINGNKQPIKLPNDLDKLPENQEMKRPKIIVFSFKHYGFTMLRSWLEPFLSQPDLADFPLYEICFIEFSFLSMAKGLFAKNILNLVGQKRINKTFLRFGGIPVSTSVVFNSILFTFIFRVGFCWCSVAAQCVHGLCVSAG